MRLTPDGREFLAEKCGIEYYIIDLKEPISSLEQLLRIDKKLDCPYFIQGRIPSKTPNKIHLFDGRISTILALHRGNLHKYLKNKL